MPTRQCLLYGPKCSNRGMCLPGASRCPAHSTSNWHRSRNPASATYYSSRAWQERRAAQLKKEPLCAMCGAKASHADHVVNIASGGDPNGPLQSLCVDCHRRKTGQEGHRARYPKGPG
jgi:5-methylcytosine-specific restriction endonuclease McrA